MLGPIPSDVVVDEGLRCATWGQEHIQGSFDVMVVTLES